MDARTAELIDALRHPGAALIVELLEESATEAYLLANVQRTTQATANRRLRKLETVGLVEREQGKSKAPGRRWQVRHGRELAAMLRAAVALATAVAEQETQERQALERRINLAQAKRQGLREVSDL